MNNSCILKSRDDVPVVGRDIERLLQHVVTGKVIDEQGPLIELR